MKILLADDDRNIRNGLTALFKKQGYECCAAADGREALKLAQSFRADLYVLDIMMPHIDGTQLCIKLRAKEYYQPILLLTAFDSPELQIQGLNIGADDYLAKPFHPETLLARVNALYRRSQYAENQLKQCNADFMLGEVSIKPGYMQAHFRNQQISITARELNFLQLLFSSNGQILTKDQILNHCWGHDYIPESRALDQFISTLRNKLEKKLGSARVIQTAHGLGYRLG
ncbi:response regulator transcription factor [Oceanospirillum beijerinckii]|uniref:response regulator transcription factor n=1 Tax=Oceanospirillum beijerinckii TaxID=64976 RepID=UPI0004047EFF|nr:response regulator transcription factor [Oceanospirillum beijerinckii]MAC48159.1 DNA-binding response regulator [Oceanospirillum sp.]